MKDADIKHKLFTASCIALIATAMTFAIRANLLSFLGDKFSLDPIELGIVTGTAFWGFTLSMIFGGPLCDVLGMKKLLIIAFTGHISGIILTIAATGFWSLFLSTLLIGIANGMVEAACNPLIATLYQDEKTKMLNKFHVWFPGGIVIGGLTGYALTAAGFAWQFQLATILIPTFLYGILFYKLPFPITERVAKGVSNKSMFAECTQPLFLVMVVCMFLTATTELGTNQWMTELLGNVGVPSILLLVFINGLMAVGRYHAGFIEHHLSPAGMLLFSAFFSALGLVLLSQLDGYWSFAAAAIFAVGVCFFWPTMLGFVAEYLPKTGSVGLAIMGGSGMLSVAFALPVIGILYNNYTQQFLQELKISGHYAEEALGIAKLMGGTKTLFTIALLPAILTLVFWVIYLKRKSLKSAFNLQS